jgi:hypothetical protein
MARPFLVPFRRLLRLAGSRWRYSTPPPHGFAQSVSKSYRAPSRARDQIFIIFWQLRSCFLWGPLSDERTVLTFVYASGTCKSSLSRVRVPWYSKPYFTLSNLRLPFPSPPTTRRVTVEVFDPASTRVRKRGHGAEQSRAVAYCWQPASTVTLGIEPRWDPVAAHSSRYIAAARTA